MTLTEQLKHIYATGDDMTVLKMLKGLIDAVEDYEGRTATSDQVEHLTEEVGELSEVTAGLVTRTTALEKPVYVNYILLYVNGGENDMYFYITIIGDKINSIDDLANSMPLGVKISATGTYMSDTDSGFVVAVCKTKDRDQLREYLTVRYGNINDITEYETASFVMKTSVSGEDTYVFIEDIYHKLLLGVENE